MSAPHEGGLTPEQAHQYRAEVAAMGWPVKAPPAPAPMRHAMHFMLLAGVALLASRDAWRACA